MVVYVLYNRDDLPVCVLDSKEEMADFLGISEFWLGRCLYFGDRLRDGMTVFEVDIGYLPRRYL